VGRIVLFRRRPAGRIVLFRRRPAGRIVLSRRIDPFRDGTPSL
jgi:hypothetical protein